MNNDSHRVLGTSPIQRSVQLPAYFSEPHTHTSCCSSLLLFSESGLHTLTFSGERLKPSPTLPSRSAEPLPRPWLSAEPVPWITSLLGTYLQCQAALRGVTFMLRLEGDDSFQQVTTAQDMKKAWFIVRKPGTYSCSYRTHADGVPSEPSASVTIKEYGEC